MNKPRNKLSYHSGRNRWGRVWQFKTKRFTVALEVTRIHNYKYDGDDEGGATQAAIDSGEMVAFDSSVIIELDDGEIVGADHLGSNVYYSGRCAEFWQDHRCANPMNRNCEAMRAAHKLKTGSDRVSICHYFPDMVKQAARSARDAIDAMPDKPKLRPYNERF